MKIERIIWIIVICLFSITMLTSCVGDKHITQKEAEKIANDLIGGGVTFVEMQKVSATNIHYVFTDSKGNIFSIISTLTKPDIDGATVDILPMENSVTDDYSQAVLACNEDAIMKILEKYELVDYLKGKISTNYSFSLDTYIGTPEENQKIVNNFVAAAVEIDTLLGMTYDRDYRQKTKYPYDSYKFAGMSLMFNKILENKDIPEICVDIAHFDFSTTEDTRWTVDSLYEHVKKELDEVELAE